MSNAVYLASLVNSSGNNVTLQGGVVGSGTGIAFPATQVASSDANTLDDYEEGTWTPNDASGAGLTFTVNRATYVKVGTAVFVYMFINFPSTANGTAAKIGGLPFTSINLSAINYQLTGRNQVGSTNVNGQVAGNSTVIDPVPLNTFNVGPANSFFSGLGLIFSGFYQSNA